VTDWISEPYRTAERLEQYLGDPLDERSAFSFARALEADEREAFPEEILGFVRGSDFDRYLIPAELGGAFDTCEGHLARHRALARRDLSVDIAIGATHLAFLPVWCAGSRPQRERFARLLREHEYAALALTERDHGADLLRSETVAVKTADGWAITGEKWLINNASRARLVCVLARTEVAGRAGLSIFLVDKAAVDAAVDRGSYEHVPKVRLHGTRGMDVCGIRLNGCRVPDDALVGAPGAGLEAILKGFALSRTTCAGKSLAPADTALRAVLDFARSRRLYGDTVLALSHARHQLAYSFADLLFCDCVAIAAARALHVTPEQSALTSAVAKYLVPTTSERIVAEVGVILGARHFLREDHWSGIFQKLRRDNELIALFDGSTVVSLSSIASQLGALMAGRRDGRRDGVAERAEALYRLDAALPPFGFERIELTARGRNDVLEGLDGLMPRLDAMRGAPGTSAAVLDEVGRLVQAVRDELERLEGHLYAGFGAGWATKQRSAEAIELARRYCVLHGVASALHVWAHNRELLGGAFARGEWLVIAGQRQLAALRGVGAPGAPVDVGPVADEMMRLFESRRAFSIVPYQLA
jgi:alkylation response protein AidB-like acyl-CoA dehydrogenase